MRSKLLKHVVFKIYNFQKTGKKATKKPRSLQKITIAISKM